MCDETVIAACFHEVEAAILRRALGRQQPPTDIQLDLWGRSCVLGPGVIRLEPSDEGLDNEARAVSDAAARLLLSGLEERLPNYLVRVPNGSLHAARGARRPRRKVVRGVSILLLGINWADSGPGMSWPEQYYATWLPGFECWCVTASRDSSEVDGYCDRLIGSIDGTQDQLEGVRALVQAEWHRQYEDESQERWVELLDAGRIGSTSAFEIAAAVWGEEAQEDEE